MEKIMKKIISMVAVFGIVFGVSQVTPVVANAAQNQHGAFSGGLRSFIDLNGDSINDNAPDDDGDGIPNGQDPDYLRNKSASGKNRPAGAGSGVCTNPAVAPVQ